MSGELERLLIRLEADTTAMRSALKDAEKGVDTFAQNADKRLAANERRFKSYQDNVSKAIKPLVGLLAGAFTAQSVAAFATEAAALDNLARSAGLTTDRYQELQYAFRAAGADTEDLKNASSKFASVMGEVRNRMGETYTFLRDQLPEVKKQLDATTNLSEAWNVATDAVGRLSSTEDKALFIKKMWGEEAAKNSAILSQGTEKLNEAAKAAHEYGTIVREDAIKNTKELTTEVGLLSNSLVARLKNAIGDVSPMLTNLVKGAREILKGDGFGKANLDDIQSMEREMKSLESAIQQISLAYARLKPEFKDSFMGQTHQQDIAQYEQRIFDLDNRMRALKEGGAKDVGAGLKSIGEWTTTSTAQIKGNTAALGEWITTSNQALTIKKKPNYAGSDALAQLREAADTASGRDMEALNKNIDQQIERYRRMLQEELISEQEFNEARSLIREGASTRIMQIMQKESQEQAKIYADMRQAIEGPVMNAMDTMFRTGKLNAKDMFKEILIGFEKMLVQALILKPIMEALFPVSGVGGIGSLFSGLFGGARASGGTVSASTPYLVGEKGPELFVPRSGGSIVNATQTAGMGSGGNTFHIDARGADIGAADRLMAAMQRIVAQQPSAMASLSAHNRRYPGRALA